MMQKRNLYSCLIDKGKSRAQLAYQDILSVKVSNQKGEKNSTQYYLQEVQEQSTDISTEIPRSSTVWI